MYTNLKSSIEKTSSYTISKKLDNLLQKTSSDSPKIAAHFYLGQNGVDKVLLFPSTSFSSTFHSLPVNTSSLEKALILWIDGYLKGEKKEALSLLSLSSIPPFEKKVYAALDKLPIKEISYYEKIAEEINVPMAARAVGNACRKNPFPLLIPCHKILRKDQSLGGYSQGLEIKKELLLYEKTIAAV